MGDVLGCITREDDVPEKSVIRDVSLKDLDVLKDEPAQPAPGFDRGDCLGKVLGHQPQPQPKPPSGTTPRVPSLSLPTVAFPQPYPTSHSVTSSSSPMNNRAPSKRAELGAKQDAKTVQLLLRTGNSRFLGNLGPGEDDALARQKTNNSPCAMVILCSPLPMPVEMLFGLSVGELGVASASRSKGGTFVLDDGGAAALELCLSSHEVSYMLVLNSQWDKQQRLKAPDGVWDTVQQLLRVSAGLRSAVSKGMVCVEGAVVDLKQGEVDFLGQHKNQNEVIAQILIEKKELQNGAARPPDVPAREAVALLQCGNKRAALNNETSTTMPGSARSMRSSRSMASSIGSARSLKGQSGNATARRRPPNHAMAGQQPIAVVFLDYDPHAGEGPLAEHLFDVNSSMLASSQTCGEDQSQEAWASHASVAEHCIKECGTRLIVVLGRAVDNGQLPYAEEHVLRAMMLLVKSRLIRTTVLTGEVELHGAVYLGSSSEPPWCDVKWLGMHPDQDELVGEGHKEYMRRHKEILENPVSPRFQDQKRPRAHERGAKSPAVTPRDRLADQESVRSSCTASIAEVALAKQANANAALREALGKLKEGNARYVSGDFQAPYSWTSKSLGQLASGNTVGSQAVVVCGSDSEARAPESIFDAGIGELVVHKTPGALGGRSNMCGALATLEELMRQRGGSQLLLVLGDARCPVAFAASQQVQNLTSPHRWANAQLALEELGPVALQALREVKPGPSETDPACASQRRVVQRTVELQVFYTMERIIRCSDYVAGLVQEGNIQVHGAVVNEDGSVQFLGMHPHLARLLFQRSAADRHKKKGMGIGK